MGITVLLRRKSGNSLLISIGLLKSSAFNRLRRAAFTENGHNLPLNLPLIVPFTFGNIDRVHFRISWLETYSIPFLLLEETF